MVVPGDSLHQSHSIRSICIGHSRSVSATSAGDIISIDSCHISHVRPIGVYSLHFVDRWRTVDFENDLPNQVHRSEHLQC